MGDTSIFNNSRIFVQLHRENLMKVTDSAIELTIKNHKVSEAKAILPIWVRKGDDKKHYINIPMLGLQTYADTEEDIEEAVNEAFIIFCKAADEHGLGIDSELEFIGWKKSDENLFELSKSRKPFINELVKTGSPVALEVQI